MAVQINMPTAPAAQAGYRVYHGLAGVQGVDWQNPVAFLPEGNHQIDIPLPMTAGQRHVLAVRRVSASGVEEQSTHVWTLAEVDSRSELLPPPLAQVQELVAAPAGQNDLALTFSCRIEPPLVAPEAFDVFTDAGTGQVDLTDPVAVVSRSRPQQTEFEILLPGQASSTLLAVRPRKGSQLGTIRIVQRIPEPAPISPRVL